MQGVSTDYEKITKEKNKLLGFITIMALITALGKIVDAVTDPLVATLSDKCTHKDGRRMPFLTINKQEFSHPLQVVR